VIVVRVQGNVALEKSERKKPFTWMPDLGWEDAVRLAEVSPRLFGKLLEDIEQNEDEWKKVNCELYFYEVSSLIQFLSAFGPRHNQSFGSRAFRFSAHRVWNSLPVSIRESQSLPTFRRHLKTFLLLVSLPHFSCPPCL